MAIGVMLSYAEGVNDYKSVSFEAYDWYDVGAVDGGNWEYGSGDASLHFSTSKIAPNVLLRS